MSQWYKKSQKEENRKTILKILARNPSAFTEILEKSKVSRATLTAHLKQLVKENSVVKVFDDTKNRVVYKITEETLIEELVIDALVTHLGFEITVRLLNARLHGQGELHLDEYFTVDKFIDNFIMKNFNVESVPTKKLLDALKKKFGTTELVI